MEQVRKSWVYCIGFIDKVYGRFQIIKHELK